MDLDRRRLLELGGVTAMVTIAGCVQAPDAEGASQPSTPSAGGSTPGEAATRTPTVTPTRSPTATPAAGASGETHTVALTDDLRFDPDAIEIAAGDTIAWENEGVLAHTATAYEARIPDGAAYVASGGFESESAARDGFPDGSIGEGETFEHTFETTGEYEYFCIPHEQAGMTGSVTVV